MRKTVILSLAAATIAFSLTSCTTETKSDLPQNTEDASELFTAPLEGPSVTTSVMAAQDKLEGYRQDHARLPVDVAAFVNPILNKYELVSASWDATNYNLCVAAPSENKTVAVQSFLGPSQTITEGTDSCDAMIPDLALDTYTSLQTSTKAILAPVGEALPLGPRFKAALDAQLQSTSFGAPRIVRASDATMPLVVTFFSQGLESVRDGAYGYACVVVNETAMIRYERYGEGDRAVTVQSVEPRVCEPGRASEAAASWYRDGFTSIASP